jgi:selenide, water dikinase
VKPRLVLAGMGHAHLFVLEALARGALDGCEVVVCTGDAEHVYSGMVPGWLGGRYARSALSLDTEQLCRRAGATRVPYHVCGLDPVANRVTLDNGDTLAFDYCSVAVGSKPAGLAVPGATTHAIALKPLQQVERLHTQLAALAAQRRGAVTVVGAGLAGLEMALASRARLTQCGAAPEAVHVTVLGEERTLVPERGAMLARALLAACARQQVTVQLGARVTRVHADALELESGERLRSDCTVWATGAAAPTWLAASGLPIDARGFLLVDEHLRSPGAPQVFGAGDCVTPVSWPGTPKAGVYAVRMGPALARTLAAAVHQRELPAPYRPQRQFLALVNTGDGRAIASRGALAVTGRWAMWWKDRLDRAFMARFARL